MNIVHLNRTQKAESFFPIVAISSASSEIEILKKVISEFPADSKMAYLIMEDLYFPQTENLALELESYSEMPVIEIVSSVDLHSNHIYVIPANNFLEIENDSLVLKSRTRSSNSANCLDFFFDSLASIYKSYTIGLVISGSAVDGFAGLKKVKEMGGTSIAILHKKGIPKNDDTGNFIDYFSPQDQVSDKLKEIQNSYLVNHAYQDNPNNSNEDEENLLKEITALLQLRTGTNFQHYKHQTIRRRIAKRMVVTHQESTQKYLNILKNSTAEQDALFNDILIPVTYFFRDTSFFYHLCTAIFPTLIENANNEILRIWSAGCSTGEEAYSLAICLHEYLEQNNRQNIKIQIFASDLSDHCIVKARSGVYTLQDVKNISSERLEKYFTKRNNTFHVNKIIQDMCVFAVHDLTKDTSFSKIDLICCRNVLIYFDTELQNQVLTSFHYSLRDNGYLFLGKAETAHNVPDLFAIVDKQEKIYIRKNETKHPKTIRLGSNSDRTKNVSPETEIDYKKIASDILLENFSPAAVMINEQLEIVYFHGDTSPFLQPASGKPSFNILNMVREEISLELRNAILKARNEKKNFSGGHIAVKKQSFLTSFEVIFLPSNLDLLLIVFCKKTLSHSELITNAESPSNEFQKELHQLRGDFKRVTEEQQIYFEELQNTNVELLTNTEELQLINEKLTASAEELQSNNKELSFLNEELQNRRDELALMRNFYESIVKTIREPVIIIDQNAAIKSANPSFYNYFNTIQEETEGISIFEIGSCHWNIPEFKESVLKKVNQGETIENFKINFILENGIKKTMLLNAAPIINSVPEGMILIALEDITELESSNESIKNKNLELKSYGVHLELFTNAASHNLLEPGRKIYMFGKKVLDSEKLLSESGKHNLHRLLNTAVNLNQLIEDLLNYSKVNFSDKSFKKTDLNIVVKKAITELKSMIQEYKAEITFDVLPILFSIPSQLKQLFSQLIINSIKYAKKDVNPQIKISAVQPSPEEIKHVNANSNRNYTKIMIKDNGMGFTKDFENLIFDPFYKLHSNENHYGSGLGLTLVHKIVSNHNGYIQVSSKPEKGTIICIYLPV
ncbi:CheR family methyltransferase [Flavobacterium sp. HBTb2-11-1]|uniref:CheR family methyltransferase n=1 Tax=Flavobacterium sp. HBTb2-11-1 TaxID=2692212 RepID=UPI001367BEA0|nr:CheR family methyltransferase [Flavobacterium sp. HBTb2-11-1]MXO05296.1 PAS domain-containing protein [Flavobacterium sp. HBTb2-11-1]